jgi:RNA-directed DNA polymerase
VSFSGDHVDHSELRSFLIEKLEALGLKLNRRKFVVVKNSKRQVVTGLVVNGRVSPGRAFLKQLRQDMYYVRRFGLRDQAERRGFNSASEYLSSLRGRVAFANQVLGTDLRTETWRAALRELSSAI